MKIISAIEDQEVIKTILNHLDLWLIRSRPPAKAHAPPSSLSFPPFTNRFFFYRVTPILFSVRKMLPAKTVPLHKERECRYKGG